MPETAPAATIERAEDSEPTMPPPVTVPVYAAGAGAPHEALDILDAAGWRHYTDGTNVTYCSPDGAVYAEFGPETERYHRHGSLWQIKHLNPDPYAQDQDRKAWTATFGDHVPTEAIAGFLTALTDPVGLELDR